MADGQEGELVFTSLTKQALPIIRYRTRDLTRLLAPTSRAFRRMARIVGRSDDMLIVRGVNVFPTQIEEQVLREPELSGNYQIVLTREGHLDNVQVRCELQPAASSISADKRAAVARSVAHHIKTLVGVSTDVQVMDFGALPRTQTGKARRVWDERPALK